MKVYLLTAAGVMFLSVVVSLLVPEGKLHKSVTFVMRLICILVLIQPVTGIFKISDASYTDGFFDYEYVSGVYSEHQSAALEKLIEEKFGESSECYVKVDYVDGQFSIVGISVGLDRNSPQLIEKIYAYLSELEYINITVYAKGS